MSRSLGNTGATMGTLPVFMTAISTILGAILFLRFGYAVAHVGLVNTLLIIVIGHLVTIPTAMAVAEIATNQKVEGGGAYFMISRSFGLNVGAAIGVALFLSQAISVAFYVIAFAVAYSRMGDILAAEFGIYLYDDPQLVGLVLMGLLTILMLTKGANIGVKALYLVVAVLFAALIFFFAGETDYHQEAGYLDRITSFTGEDGREYPAFTFFYMFTIIFPAFTGIAAGLGLSGDLKDPKRSIPRGTLWATLAGIVVYIAVAFKLFHSASLEDLAADELIMTRIAYWGPIIPIGLACAAISSALGSIMIAPRTLQALGVDNIFPDKLSQWFARGRKKSNEPVNASIITCAIGFIFVAVGDIDSVARIISMFFMVTYGAICMISFLEHFAGDPSYRPTFRSRWYFSIFGAMLCFYLMFKMDFWYAVLALVIMVGIHQWVSSISKDKSNLANLMKGVIFQANRQLQIYLQKRENVQEEDHWRPFVISISDDTFHRRAALDLVRWIAHKYGFGTYLHFIEGFLGKDTYQEAAEVKERLIKLIEGFNSKVYLDTIISPSYTSAIAQSIQLPGISGKGNNMIVFEFSDSEPESLRNVITNYNLLQSTDFDVCVLRSSYKGFGYHREIHIWISPLDYENSSLMILLAYIMLGHPEWKKGFIKIFSVYPAGQEEEQKQ
ncbi:MAG: amino acid permease, partial [Bacteroidota bacterium]